MSLVRDSLSHFFTPIHPNVSFFVFFCLSLHRSIGLIHSSISPPYSLFLLSPFDFLVLSMYVLLLQFITSYFFLFVLVVIVDAHNELSNIKQIRLLVTDYILVFSPSCTLNLTVISSSDRMRQRKKYKLL